ncbi:YihY/virulence factor BrkB family protein [Sphingosinicella sp. YJ22]|uniref:YihY/virulence factor BrkB family protein n=1 Tax=Sphingosinicella sp. YJ22 TaxID=1104780 RepID=UPI001FAED42B|nr:YihY/virulence factor BrkB family protein [Sphingosinicella sp. YJ22]
MDPTLSPESPEARLKAAALEQAHPGQRPRVRGERRARAWIVTKRVAVGVYNDGFIHAGNLAYLSILSIFPFIIVAAAVTRLLGQTEGGVQTLNAMLETMPPSVAEVLRQPIKDVIAARSGSLLWLGALIGLWTAGSFIETIRDIIRRAYGVKFSAPFWEYRLASTGMTVLAVVAIMLSLSVSVALSGVQRLMLAEISWAQELVGVVTLLRIVPALVLFGALYLLFWALTPSRYRAKGCPKWPGAAFVAGWWVLITALLPEALGALGGYDLTYGSLAGVAIALLFFFLVGFGVVIGAELNAALAETPVPTHEDVVAAVQEEKFEEAKEAADEVACHLAEEEAEAEQAVGDESREREKRETT